MASFYASQHLPRSSSAFATEAAASTDSAQDLSDVGYHLNPKLGLILFISFCAIALFLAAYALRDICRALRDTWSSPAEESQALLAERNLREREEVRAANRDLMANTLVYMA